MNWEKFIPPQPARLPDPFEFESLQNGLFWMLKLLSMMKSTKYSCKIYVLFEKIDPAILNVSREQCTFGTFI